MCIIIPAVPQSRMAPFPNIFLTKVPKAIFTFKYPGVP